MTPRAAWFTSLLVALAGCAGSEPAAPPRPFRFAVLPAPALGDPAALDRLYLALDRLSAEGERLDLVLVPGPLVEGDDPLLIEELAGVVGSLPAPVVVAPGPADAPREAALLAALERAFQGQTKTRRPRRGWQALPVGLDGAVSAPPPEERAAGGEGEEEEPAPPRRILVSPAGIGDAAGASDPTTALRVEVGDAAALEVGPQGPRLALPPLRRPPHLLGLATVDPQGTLSLELLALEGQAPPPPAPLSLSVPPGAGAR